MFDRITTKYATDERPMLKHKFERQYKGISFTLCRRRVELFALGLASLGVKKDEKVAIISEKRPEWVVADMGIVALGAVDVSIYPTLTPPQIAYILSDAEVKIVIVSNALQLGKILNLCSNIKAAANTIPLDDRDSLLSFLPLCHSFERMAGYYTAMACGSTVAYAESTETVSDNLLEVRPTIVTTRMFLAALIVPGFDILKSYARNAEISFSVDADLTQKDECEAQREGNCLPFFCICRQGKR